MIAAKMNQEITNLSLINVDRFNNHHKLLRVTCRLWAMFRCRAFKGILKEPTVDVQHNEARKKGYDGDMDEIMSRSVYRLVVLLSVE